MFRTLMHLFNGNATDHNMETAGLVVGRPGRVMHIFAKVAAVVADEGALHAFYACKGASGLKPCLLCTNVYQHSSVRDVVDNDATGVSVSHTCSDVSLLKLHTCATVDAVLRSLAHLAAQPKSKGKLEELETCLGWRHDPGALLSDGWLLPRMYPGAACIFDWMHVIFVNGVFGVAVGQLMRFAMHKDPCPCMVNLMSWRTAVPKDNGFKQRGLNYAAMHDAIVGFEWPHLVGTCADVFAPKRAASHWEDTTFKVSASEGLSVVPFMLYFMREAAAVVNDASLDRHVSCFAQLCGIVQVLHGAPFYGVDTSALQRDVGAFLTAFKGLYGDEVMTPKFHYMYCFARARVIESSLQRAHEGNMTTTIALATTTATMMATMVMATTLATTIARRSTATRARMTNATTTTWL